MNIETIRQHLEMEEAIRERCSFWIQYDVNEYYFHFDKSPMTVRMWSNGSNHRYDDTDYAEIPLDVFLSTTTKQEADKVKDRWKEEARLKRLEEERARKKKEKLDKIEADRKKEENEYQLWQTLNKKYGRDK